MLLEPGGWRVARSNIKQSYKSLAKAIIILRPTHRAMLLMWSIVVMTILVEYNGDLPARFTVSADSDNISGRRPLMREIEREREKEIDRERERKREREREICGEKRKGMVREGIRYITESRMEEMGTLFVIGKLKVALLQTSFTERVCVVWFIFLLACIILRSLREFAFASF